jgi:hypothetical protein
VATQTKIATGSKEIENLGMWSLYDADWRRDVTGGWLLNFRAGSITLTVPTSLVTLAEIYLIVMLIIIRVCISTYKVIDT